MDGRRDSTVAPESGQRLRRLRTTAPMRRLVAEHHLRVDDLIAPLFCREGIDAPVPVPSLPGVAQLDLDSLEAEVAELVDLGVPAVMLFGVPLVKDPIGSGASDADGIVQRALGRLRRRFDDEIVLIADLCLDEYTDHGHCGVLTGDGRVDNDATLVRYGEVAVAQASAGAHVVAPSGMMDHQVAAIRGALDAAGFVDVSILAYSAKYASALYGPFRDAVDVSIADGGDRATYQQDVRNARESVAEVLLDVAEGADMVMVKPAGPNLDIVAAARQVTRVPIAAYQVSGEYAMVKAADENGWIDGGAVAMEQLVCIKRAGADMIVTYFAKDAATRLKGERR
ncbi:MAG: porphobilinogen synthase [Microthrixaceae bacterium]